MVRRWSLVIALLGVVYSSSAMAVDFPIYMAGCYTKSTVDVGATKRNSDRTAWADIDFLFCSTAGCTAANIPCDCCTGSGTGCATTGGEIYCDVQYPVGNGSASNWTFTYEMVPATTIASKNVCWTASGVVPIAGENFYTGAINAGTLKSCAITGTASLVDTLCASTALSMTTVADVACTSSCEKYIAKLKFERNISGCTTNYDQNIGLKIIHVNTALP